MNRLSIKVKVFENRTQLLKIEPGRSYDLYKVNQLKLSTIFHCSQFCSLHVHILNSIQSKKIYHDITKITNYHLKLFILKKSDKRR